VSIYVPAAGTAMLKAPLADVVTVGSGEATTPQGMLVADCAFRHVAASGSAPTATVKPASGAPEVSSTVVPVTARGAGLGVGVGDIVGEAIGEPLGTAVGMTEPPPLEPPPPPQAASESALSIRTPATENFASTSVEVPDVRLP
jgi:hypothetical protein